MYLNSIIAGAIVAAGLFTPGAAGAVPTATVDGVTFPVGIVPNGNQIQSGILDETLITGSGQTLNGIGLVNVIDQGLTTTWTNGQNGVELAFYFTNYTSNASGFPTITFTGGNAAFYVLPAGTNISGGSNLAADIATIQSGTLFLTVNAAPEDAAGDTLVSTITSGASIGSYSAGDGNGFLDVVGGPAAGAFGTGTFTNEFDTNGLSDLSLTTDFTVGSTVAGAGVAGSATLKANAVPEPASLSVTGFGLLALAAFRRRKHSTPQR
jgi:hypothetical protein